MSKRAKRAVAGVLLLLGLISLVAAGTDRVRNLAGLAAVGVFWLSASILLYSLYQDWYCKACGRKVAKGKKPAGACPGCGAEEFTTTEPGVEGEAPG